MKKILLFAAATAVALSSCSKDEVTSTSADIQKEISFSTYVGNTTKAVMEDDTFLSFTVNAEFTGNDVDGTEKTSIEYFTTDVVRTNASSAWDTDNSFFWPTNGSLSFFAYNNDLTAATPAFTTSANTIGFKSTTGTDDLVVATSTVLAPADHATAATNVQLTFSHVLTKVMVALQGDVTDVSTVSPEVDAAADYKFVISSVTLNGIVEDTYTFSTGWSATVPTTGQIDMTYTSAADADVFSSAATSLTDQFMLIPATKATFKVAYTVLHKSDSEDWVVIAEHIGDNAKSVDIAALKAAGTNTKYVLSLPIDGKKITFTSSSLTEWDTTTNSDVPANVQ